jgi:hypothetical protein
MEDTVKRLHRIDPVNALLLILNVVMAVYLLGLLGGCGGQADSGAAEAEPFGWCCEGVCGLDPIEADPYERCECPGGYIHPVLGTRGQCLPLTEDAP